MEKQWSANWKFNRRPKSLPPIYNIPPTVLLFIPPSISLTLYISIYYTGDRLHIGFTFGQDEGAPLGYYFEPVFWEINVCSCLLLNTGGADSGR